VRVDDVQAAYKDWLCASLLMGAVGDDSSWRCRVYCDRVARHCPYLLPQIDYSYVGEPAFSCTGMTGPLLFHSHTLKIATPNYPKPPRIPHFVFLFVSS